MKLSFTKMHGCGNDYIYINCIGEGGAIIDSPESLAVKLSNRHFGIGGDGLVLIMPSSVADARMRMFNLDGSEGRMCGNAIRCVAKFLYDNDIVPKLELTIETLSGIKTLSLNTKDSFVTTVRVDMGRAELSPKLIPVTLNVEGEGVINERVMIGSEQYYITCVSMGNPHAVVFCDDVDSLDLKAIGTKFETSPLFPEGVNTEFVEVLDKNNLKMRVWERGSGETLACGTGACASVVAAVENGYCRKGEDITVSLIGGELLINYTDEAVFMTGGCEKVFDGVVLV